MARAALDKKAKDLIILDLKGLTIIADYFIICSGENITHVRAIAEGVEERSAKAGIRPLGVEGLNYSHWVLMDYSDVMLHIFEKETRGFYELEKLWMDAKKISLGEHDNE